ncbi:MAG: hypothetical protein JSR66_28015 [Proteobacteria bacterium]|nr:hypothetical protein [Pseudomonadota bacterium]
MRLRWLAALALTWVWGPAGAADLPFKVLSTGKVQGRVEAGLSQARDRKALAQMWSRMGLTGAVPKVNFKQRMVVAWVGGGSACDKYVLAHVRDNTGDVVLEIERVQPPPGHMCIMMFVPSRIVASIPITSKAIRFNVPDGSGAGAESR